MSSIPEVAARQGMFVRKSTGLVRDVSPVSALLFNALTAVPGLALAFSIFYILGTYPGGHIESAYVLTGLIAIAIALPFAVLSMTMPRSGGDYILVSRALHPALGLASSLTLFAAVMIAEAFFASTFVSVGLAPGFGAIGLVSGNTAWVDIANDVSTKNWTFGLGILMTAIALGLASLRLRTAMKVGITIFAIGMVAMFAAAIAMFATSQSAFVSHFDAIAGVGQYEKLISLASREGISSPGQSWANTIPAIGVLSAFFAFSWWSANYSGEIQRARTWRTPAVMTASVGIVVLTYALFTVALFHMTGDRFIAASNAFNGTNSYPLSVAPFWVVLAGIGTKSTALTAFLALTFLLWIPLALWQNAAQPTRALFAWSFDGILPRRVADVNERTGVPIIAIASTFVGIVAATAWAVYSSNFFTVLATTTLMLIVPMIFVALSALLLPFTKPALWQLSPLRQTIGGVPLMSLVGALGLAASGFIFFIPLRYLGLGLNRHNTVIALAILLASGVIGYYIALLVQRRRGVDISLNYAEIPPE